ncbi:hypothetical protein EJC47_15795 [Sphingomonas sp. TF3]|uniref:hypothetical protein n=1 Tax=Sphingomonas sp. TF3 TaxID=2495580 RepID=UPI000F879FD1|nr:hypothetical protein [Sphingomonas sp. TF3]RUN75492.1 hypothetical protein EJC47_15795 [Sphingomonas sp. TF3]
MAKNRIGATSTSPSTALATIKRKALTPSGEVTLAKTLGSEGPLAKMPGTGGEVIHQSGIVRVTGRDYATDAETVPASEIYFVARKKLGNSGPWLNEADKVAWIDPRTGYECIMLRHDPDGFLSGYVGVPEDHPLFGWDHEAIAPEIGIDVHGGLTYSRICNDEPSPQWSLEAEAHRICHVVVGHASLNTTDDRVHSGQWWLGFECNHLYDVVPGRPQHRQGFMGAETHAEYRDDAYVVREILNLAAQLKALALGEPVPARDGPPLPSIGLDPKRGG